MPNQAQLKRYDHTSTFGRSESRMNLEPYGDYVKYSDIEPLIEALRFYANPEHWHKSYGSCSHNSFSMNKDCGDVLGRDGKDVVAIGGKAAREALKGLGL